MVRSPRTPRTPCSPRTAVGAVTIALAVLVGSPLLGTATAAPEHGAGHHARSGHGIDTSSRAAVRRAWKKMWAPATRSAVRPRGGSAAGCRPFTVPAKTHSAMRRAINFAREMAGLDPISDITDSRTSKAAKSALIQAANDTLTHYPTRNMRCYTKAGASAARQSDIGYYATTSSSWRPAVTTFVNGYLNDTGAANAQVGHRRWLLRPQTTTMGNGYARATDGRWHVYTNDLVVFPTRRDNAHAAKPKFIPWPTAGWFPTQLEPKGRWSISSGRAGISLAHAKVRVTHKGRRVAVQRLGFTSMYPGDRTIVFRLAGKPAKITGTGTSVYKVRVSHIKGAKPYTYEVRLFKP